GSLSSKGGSDGSDSSNGGSEGSDSSNGGSEGSDLSTCRCEGGASSIGTGGGAGPFHRDESGVRTDAFRTARSRPRLTTGLFGMICCASRQARNAGSHSLSLSYARANRTRPAA